MAGCIKKKDNFMLIAILYRAMLDWSYYILSNSAYNIEFLLNINPIKLLFSYIVVIFICYKTINQKKISAFFFRIIIFFTIIPVSTVYCMRNESSLFFLLTTVSFYCVEYFVFKVRIRDIHSENYVLEHIDDHISGVATRKKPTSVSKYLSYCCILASLLTLALMFKYNGIPNFNTLKLSSVYEVRESYKTSKYLGYLTALTAMVIVPFGVAEGKLRNNKCQVLFYMVVQLSLFLWTGHKTWLFSIFVLLFIIVTLNKGYSLNIMFTSVTIFILFTNVFYCSNNQIIKYAFSLINRRVLLDPAALKFFYNDYFILKGNPVVGFSGTIVAPFISRIDGNNTLYYTSAISSQYTGITSNAGTGLYGGDIANIGIFAFLIVPLLLILLAYLIEKTNKHCGTEFTILLFTYLSYSLNDQRIFSFFLDFKGILLIIIVVFYKIRKQYEDSSVP